MAVGFRWRWPVLSRRRLNPACRGPVSHAGHGISISFSIFEDQAGAERSAAAAREHVKENLASLFPNPPEIMDGEVLVKAP